MEQSQLESQIEAISLENEAMRNEFNGVEISNHTGSMQSLKELESFSMRQQISQQSVTSLIKDGGKLKPVGMPEVKTLTP